MKLSDKSISEEYNPSEIEPRWQKKWEEVGVYKPDLDKAKKPFYNLMMFPYPSAEGMHVGNMYAFTGADVYGRFQRMQGKDVFEPIGLDGFGIHSENYAIKVGKHPVEQAKISEKNFYRQLKSIGNGFDWTRAVETYKPEYYKWTQWLFIQLFKAGLAYRKKAPVNFCPSCKTVLADEQVVTKLKITEDVGVCERCETEIEKRELEQWFFKITKYADRLLANIAKLDWTEKVKIAQRQWIGKSEGATIKFQIQNSKSQSQNMFIEVFTTRPDTLFGATFLVLSSEHPIIVSMLGGEFETTGSHLAKLKSYVEEIKKKREQDRVAAGKEKTGVFTGVYGINPLNQEKVPVWIADYALMGYGTGALFGDAHDKRDVEFARKYKIPLKPTIMTGDKEKDSRIKNLEECYTGEGILFDSGEFSGLSSAEAKKKIVSWLEDKGSGKKEMTYHLRDWLISRQRYWGPPIPMIYCKKCNWQPVPEKDLPVLLPNVKDWKPTGTGKSPLATIESFVNTKCPNCNGLAKRETDVSDTFLDSAWYFLRYLATEFDDVPFPMEKKMLKPAQHDIRGRMKWLPVAMYIGGAEHSVLHLLYSRFIAMVLQDLGFINFEEPFAKFRAHGLLIRDAAKMSKSKGNVVTPDAYIKKFGADTLRTYLMFMGPFSQGGDFRDSGIEGMHRFLRRVWTLVQRCHPEFSSGSKMLKQVQHDNKRRIIMHRTIKKVTEDIQNLRYNTAIAALMEWYNFLKSKVKSQKSKVTEEETETFLKLLAPFAPHVTEELYQKLKVESGKLIIKDKKNSQFSTFNSQFSIHLQSWPTYDPKFLVKDEVIVVVQFNGKLRGSILVDPVSSKDKAKIEELAKKDSKVQDHLVGKSIRKVIYVEGKVINFVV